MHSKHEPKACVRCNIQHICTQSYHCDCMAVDIPEKLISYMEFHFDDCLCMDCLEELKNKES
jgi:hypothetical protein